VISPARSAHVALLAHVARPHRRLPPLAVAVVLATGLGACRVDKNAFEDRIFHCDTTSPDPLCGTDSSGAEMTCFAARQIGGVDFCSPYCGDEPMSLPDGECVQGNAKLKKCNPSLDSEDAPACGRSDLGCLRTNVISVEGIPDEGVCLTMNPCSVNTDCRDPVRSTCAATFLRELYTKVPPADMDPTFKSDHLYCLQEGCDKNGASCSPGETCLTKVIPPEAHPIDVCVPNCDSLGRCPPNHFCLSTVSGPANPPVCIPGLLGFVCQHDVDCLLGKCLSDGDPTSALTLCTAGCDRDEDCTKFDSVQGHFVCSEDHRCITPDAYTGTLCKHDTDCGKRDPGTKCRRAPGTPTTAPTTCLRPCDPTLGPAACPARGGIGHTCLPFIDPNDPTNANGGWACYPGGFGFPCFDKSQCSVPELNCVGADLTNKDGPVPGFCTVVCGKDSDCKDNRWTGGDGYCGGANLPFCVPLSEDGAACDDAKQCQSKKCGAPTESMADAPAKVCGGTP
jgi:hypothetical protein